jgi:chromosome segregation ATPase
LAGAQRQTAVQQAAVGQQQVQITHLTEEITRLQEAARAAQEQMTAIRSERDQLTYQLQETASARRHLQEHVDVTQQALTEARMALAGQEKETQLLTGRLTQTEQKMEKLEQERVALLTERADLQALVAKRTVKDTAR